MSDLASMFRDMITRDPNPDASSSTSSPSKASTSSGARVENVVNSDDDDEGASGKSPKGKKQTTLFGFIKPKKEEAVNGKGKGKGKGKGVDEDAVDDHLAGVDAYVKPKGHYLAQAVKKMGGRKLRVATMCRWVLTGFWMRAKVGNGC